MNTNHTPGPWKHDDVYGLIKHGRTEIAALHSGNLANARLIANAPALLAALQHVSDAYQRHFDVMPVAWQTIDNIVNAAIARATGEN